ncbi:MAG: HNH endonuclease [Actinomycetia bacterium]|nr:HNH endonuclease [Actinomycetes bacterium]
MTTVAMAVVVVVVVAAVPASPVGDKRRSVVERLACDCRVNLALTDDSGKPLSIGRESRVVPKRIRTALELRENGMCQFPGCATTRGLHAHHVVHWLHGGPTELGNLILLCSFHHQVIHDGGHSPSRWSVEPHEGGFLFRTPAAEPATVEHSSGSVNRLYWHTRQKVSEFTTLEPIDGGRLTDLSWITTAIIHNAHNKRSRTG